jgi:RimJ/RimL family protein N-acetyltransferase
LLAALLGDPATGAELETMRLCLRPSRRSDLEPLHEAIVETLDELVRWLPWARGDHSRRDTREYLRRARAAWVRRTSFELVIEERGNRRIVGVASLHRIDWMRRSAGLGYWVRRAAQGHGFATEAAGALVEHGFRAHELHRIEALVAVGNDASHRVIGKLGFTREGIAREVELVNGAFCDHVQYSLLRGEHIATAEDPAARR